MNAKKSPTATKKNNSAPATVDTLKPGQVVKIHQRIKEGNKERIQIFEGIIIDTKGKNAATQMFTVRKVVDGVGVEKIFPTASAFIQKIEVVKVAKVRRSNLGYLRTRTGKSARMKDERITSLLFGQSSVSETPIEESIPEEAVVVENANSEGMPTSSEAEGVNAMEGTDSSANPQEETAESVEQKADA